MAFNPRRTRSNTKSSVERKESERLQLLMTLYELANGTENDVLTEDVQRATEMDREVFNAADEYLTGENLIGGQISDHIRLTHAGVVECEDAMRAAREPSATQGTEHFQQAVVQSVVHNHFHGAVAAVQSGSGTIGSVQQTISYSSSIPDEMRQELGRLLAELRAEAARANLEPDDRREALEALDNTEKQLAKPKPLHERIQAYLQIYATVLSVASPTLEKLQHYLPVALGAMKALVGG